MKTGVILEGKFYDLKDLTGLLNALVDVLADKLLYNAKSITTNNFHSEINYTVPDVAKKLRRSSATITRHCRCGLLKANKVGKSWIISEEAYVNYKNNKYY